MGKYKKTHSKTKSAQPTKAGSGSEKSPQQNSDPGADQDEIETADHEEGLNDSRASQSETGNADAGDNYASGPKQPEHKSAKSAADEQTLRTRNKKLKERNTKLQEQLEALQAQVEEERQKRQAAEDAQALSDVYLTCSTITAVICFGAAIALFAKSR